MEAKHPRNMDWKNLGFDYIQTDYRYRQLYKDGKWLKGEMVDTPHLLIHEASPVVHYGQHCFEGLKAYQTKTGEVQIFRPYENARRLNQSARRLVMPEVPEDHFVHAVKETVQANMNWFPPYESGATLYIRPFLMGVGDLIGVRPAEEYIFSVFVMPVGPYFKGGVKPTNFLVTDYDRAAPNGTGSVKAGGNYGGSLLPGKLAKDQGFSDAVYLDPETHTKIEEVGSANFFGITRDNTFITPKSPSILPSITKVSVMHLAQERLGLKVVEGDVRLDELDQLKEAGAMGTAASIAPIGGLQIGSHLHTFYSQTEIGPVTDRLRNELIGIQYGDLKAPEGWVEKV